MGSRKAAVISTWAFWVLLLLLNSATAFGASLRLVSTLHSSQAPVSGGNGDSFGAAVTPDGRFVLFASSANNLVLNSASNPLPVLIPAALNVFVRDRSNATTTLVSVNLSGLGGGNGVSVPSAISTNGRYALFESSASDLVGGDTNKVTDIFVRDLVSGATTLVSASTNGEFANKESRSAVMTPDGHYVAFVSVANNLVADDTNGIADVFVRDLQTSNTVLVSVGARSTNSIFSSSELPDITPDGRYVAFYSTATNLVPGVTTVKSIYVRDLVGGTTIWASTNARTLAQPVLLTTNIASYNHAISADGKYVAFQCSTNSVPVGAPGVILRHSLESGETERVHTNAYVPLASRFEDICTLDLTPDGRFIVFVANTNGTIGATTCVYRWDGNTGNNLLVSGNLSNGVEANSICNSPSISTNGRYVAFVSRASLVTNVLMGEFHVYVRDVQAGTTLLADMAANSTGVGASASGVPQLSADGTTVVFDAMDSALVENDWNHDYDVFARVVTSTSTELVSVRHSALGSVTPNGSSGLSGSPSSAIDDSIVFFSEADNLVLNDTNGARDVFVRNRLSQMITLVSVATNGISGDGPSTWPIISGEGRFVAFSSAAANLVAGDTNRAQDVFVRDLQNETTTLVSVNVSGVGPGNFASHSPMMSESGRYVLFRSRANNLAGGSFTGGDNLFLRDTSSATTYALTFTGGFAATMTRDGRYVAFNEGSKLYLWDTQAPGRIFTNNATLLDQIGISPDGTRLASLGGGILTAVDRLANSNWVIATSVFGAPRAGLLFTGDGRFLAYAANNGYTFRQAWAHDFLLRTNLLLSRSLDGTNGANGHCDSPAITPDGRLVVFRSTASNLVSVTDAIGWPDLFLHDRSDGTTSLLSISRYSQTAGDSESLVPVWSSRGRTLFMQSWASDLVSGDFNGRSDVLLLDLLAIWIELADNPMAGPTIHWWTRPGETYEAQFKNALSDAAWQPVIGTITFAGDRASITDQAPASGQRLYRVTAF